MKDEAMDDDTFNNDEITLPQRLTHDESGKFAAGNNLGRGRPKGSRNKLSEEFLSALYADFEAHGADAIARVRQDRPHEYIKVIASLLPKELAINGDEDLSDAELDERIRVLAGILSVGAVH